MISRWNEGDDDDDYGRVKYQIDFLMVMMIPGMIQDDSSSGKAISSSLVLVLKTFFLSVSQEADADPKPQIIWKDRSCNHCIHQT